MEQAIKKGSLSCDYRWGLFAKPTGKYLEMRFSHSIVTVSQVNNPHTQPRNVVFRENAKLGNMNFLFPELEEERKSIGVPHLLLIHGHQALAFTHLAVPSVQSKTKYLWRSRNLVQLPHEIISDPLPSENTDFNLDDLELLKEAIDRRSWGDDK